MFRVLGWNLKPDPSNRLGGKPVDADVIYAQQRGLDSIRFQTGLCELSCWHVAEPC